MENNNTPAEKPELRWMDDLARWLDNKFRIPGTNIRFGADFLIGLVPYAGDVISFGISALLVLAMSQRGASGMVLVKMVWNILLDGAVGTIPLLGDIFDLRYRANLRNINLLREHYREGKHGGSAWWVVVLLVVVLIGLFALSIWVVSKILEGLWFLLS